MSRVFSRLALGIALTWSAVAQESAPQPAPRPRSADRGIVLEPGPKLRYVAKQADLTEKQLQDVEALLAVFDEAMKGESTQQALIQRLQEIQVKVGEMDEAKKAGKTAEVERIKDEIRKLTPGYGPEKDFYDQLSQGLNDEQKTRLEHARKKIEANPDVSLQPLDVIQTAQSLDLQKDQRDKLDTILTDFRNEMATNRPALLADKLARVDKLVDQVRGVLNPDQQKKFDKVIDRLRPPIPDDVKAAMSSPPSSGPRIRVSGGTAIPITVTPEERDRSELVVGDDPIPVGGPSSQPAGSQPSKP